jgi:hypothetical protein
VSENVKEERTKALDEKFCESCGVAIKTAAEICPHCGVRQKTSGIIAFFSRKINAVKEKISLAKKAIDEEVSIETGISMPRKIAAILVALSAGWTGITGLGSLVAGRPKAGSAMLGIPLVLGLLTVFCFIMTIISAIASIIVIGIPFFIFFGGMLMVVTPLFLTTYIGFYIADVMICIKAK